VPHYEDPGAPGSSSIGYVKPSIPVFRKRIMAGTYRAATDGVPIAGSGIAFDPAAPMTT
jgi:hypothetical protein